MRILVNDFSGHAFPIQLSRWLASEGHQVMHTHCPGISTPKGPVAHRVTDPTTLQISPILLPGNRPFAKYNPLLRIRDEHQAGKEVVNIATDFAPEVILSGQMPLLAQRLLQKYASQNNVRFVFWLQDLYGIGIRKNLAKRMPLGDSIGRMAEMLEARLLRKSDHVVIISEDFRGETRRMGVDDDKVTAIENWAPIDEIPTLPKENAWSRQHDLYDKRVIMYTGTLGLKHNPELLAQIAEQLRDIDDLIVVVASEGLGADYLKTQKAKRNLDNLVLLDFQPYESLPQVMASADVLVAILEKDAGSFSVPSKVLSYLCAGRAIVIYAPENNLAVRVIREANAGLATGHTAGEEQLATVVRRLLSAEELRSQHGAQGRRYAERVFGIATIGAKFLGLLTR